MPIRLRTNTWMRRIHHGKTIFFSGQPSIHSNETPQQCCMVLLGKVCTTYRLFGGIRAPIKSSLLPPSIGCCLYVGVVAILPTAGHLLLWRCDAVHLAGSPFRLKLSK